jgi:tyrosine-protein phosphatase SIW14
MPIYARWSLGLVIAALVTIVPVVHFRWVYTHGKRLREVTPGKFYRSGEMTAAGFREAVTLHRFRTIVNLQDEYPDPDLFENYSGGSTIRESELCRALGVRYVYLPPDLIPRRQVPGHRPQAIDRFLTLLDDPSNYPVLIHCRAGLHRTGVMTAVYRMEYEGWSSRQAIEELKANGFGEWPCTAANDYITQYILTYQRGLRQNPSMVRSP